MGTIHFFNGQDGGVGKSTTTKVVADYCIDRAIPIKLFDADRKEDVYRTYKDKYPIQTAIFNEGEDYQNSANIIFDAAIESEFVIVNLPANVFHSLSDWFDKNNIFEIAEEAEVCFNNWFVTDGDPDKISNLEQNLAFFGDRCQRNILIQNHGKRKNWDDFNQSKIIKKLVKNYNLIVLKLPKLIGNLEKDIISKEFLTFAEARNYKFQSTISNSRIRSFVHQSFKMLDESKIFDIATIPDLLESNFQPTKDFLLSHNEERLSQKEITVDSNLNGQCVSAFIDISPEK